MLHRRPPARGRSDLISKAINRKANQDKDNESHCYVEAAFRLFGHDSRLHHFMFAERFYCLSIESGRVFLYDRVLPLSLPFNEPPQVTRRE